MSLNTKSDEEYFLREISVDSLSPNESSNGWTQVSDSVVIGIWQKMTCDVGCVVWDSAIMLAKYLDHKSVHLSLNNAKVVELGAGTGLVGVVAAALGSEAVITDLRYCLHLMNKNVEQNKHLIKDRVIVKEFDWSQTVGHQKETFFDWNLNEINYVLVSDCLYYEQSIEPLYETIVWLSSKGAVVLISYEDRESKQHLIHKFFDLVSNNRKLELKSVPSEELHPEYKSNDLHLIRISHQL